MKELETFDIQLLTRSQMKMLCTCEPQNVWHYCTFIHTSLRVWVMVCVRFWFWFWFWLGLGLGLGLGEFKIEPNVFDML